MREKTAASYVEIVQHRSRVHPERTAFLFLANGEEEAGRLTFADLDRQARCIGRALQRSGAAGERVLLLFPSGVEYVAAFLGCLYAGAVAVPSPPPASRRTLPRLLSIVRDAVPSFALTTSPTLSKIEGWLSANPDVPPLRWIATDRMETEAAEGWRPSGVAGGDVAFLQYTSGSTSLPKGVMVTHANLLHNQVVIRNACGHSERSIFVSWLPIYHDLGLIGNLLQAAFVGGSCVLMSPAAFLQRPARWLEAVSRHGGTTSGGPNFAYDLCVRKIPAEQRRSLDLSRWEVAFNGAEPVRAATLEGFAKAFADSGFRPSAFYPCYGLAEATLMVSGGRPAEPPVVRAVAADKLADGGAAAPPEGDDARTRRLVGCGAVLDGQTLAIVDPATGTRLGEGEVGEVWLSSPSVAAGYWRRPEETATTFGATLASGEGPFLRTGDLGFLVNGELFIAGRLKDLIILRGRNHYPQDLEATACESHPALIGGLAAAFCQERAGEERLLIVQELGRRHGVNLEAVVEAIRRSVAEEHEVQVAEVVLIPAGALPRTSSGKVQRGLCRTLLLSGEMAVRARSVLDSAASDAEEVESGPAREDLLRLDDPQRLAELERWLRRRIARAVGTGPSRILSDSHLSELGFDSLMAAELKNALEEEQGISLPLAVLLDGPTLEELARVVLQRLSVPPEPQALPAAAGAGGAGETCDLPLSGMQEALWFLQRLAPEAAAYNVAFAARLPAGVDGGALRRAFRGVVRRHSALRATFSERGGRPMQRAGPPPEMLVEVGAAGWSDAVLMERLTADANRPFDLERGPALRSVLYPRSDEAPYLLLVFHHLVIDGRSLWRLLEELGERYRLEREGGAAPAPPTASYRDFVAWQEALLDGPEGKRLRELWRARVGGLAAPELPADRLRRAAPLAPRGSSWRFHIGTKLTSSLRALAATRRTTLSTVLLAVFEVLLHRWTGQDEFLLGTAVWGRSRPELADVVGCLFNVVPVAVSLSSRLIFEDHLCRVQEVIRQAVDNQDYPSHRLAADLGRTPGERGLFDVMFIWQRPQWVGGSAALTHMDGRLRLNVQGLEMEPLPVQRRFARQELELEVIDAGEALDAAFHYDAEIFHEATVARMARHLENLLTAAAAVPGSALEDLGLLDAEEERQLLSDFNRADRDYSLPVSVHGLFARQAARTPAQTAAVGPRGELTYGELDARSRALADLIRTVTG